MPKITVDRRLYLTADEDRLVEHGDPDAAFLWAIEGREVDADEADELGYSPSGTKAASEPENKAVEAPEDDKSEDENVCPECGFEAKTAGGLAAHQRSHE